MSEEVWTAEKDALRKQLNREYAKLKRDKTRVRRFGPKPRKEECKNDCDAHGIFCIHPENTCKYHPRKESQSESSKINLNFPEEPDHSPVKIGKRKEEVDPDPFHDPFTHPQRKENTTT